MRARLLHAAPLAVALIAFGAAACSDPLGNCGQIIVLFDQDTVRVPVGGDTAVAAATVSSCPDKIPPSVIFASADTTIATVHAVDSTSAIVHGLKADTTGLSAQSTHRTNVRSAIPIVVTP